MPEMGSDSFDEFLAVIGEKIRLGGWERYRGGLDVKGNYYYIIDLVCELCNENHHHHHHFSGDMTGKYSVYTLYEGHEIMFHVSTLLPFSRDNRQQVIKRVYFIARLPRGYFRQRTASEINDFLFGSFHVLLLLGYPRNLCLKLRVQVERKRHIGNDIVNIVFIDEGDLSEFSPSCIKSQFTRILFTKEDVYRVLTI